MQKSCLQLLNSEPTYHRTEHVQTTCDTEKRTDVVHRWIADRFEMIAGLDFRAMAAGRLEKPQ